MQDETITAEVTDIFVEQVPSVHNSQNFNVNGFLSKPQKSYFIAIRLFAGEKGVNRICVQVATNMVHIVSWNVASWATTLAQIRRHHGSLARYLDLLQCDILCVQETKLTREKLATDAKVGWVGG